MSEHTHRTTQPPPLPPPPPPSPLTYPIVRTLDLGRTPGWYRHARAQRRRVRRDVEH